MKYLIIGASAAGINAAKTLRKLDPESQITMVSIDDRIYSRSMLHLYISFKRDLNSLNFTEKNFFEKYNINWIKGRAATSLDPNKKQVLLDNGETQSYDKLLIATGSSPIIPNIKNIDKAKNIYVLRDIDDAKKIQDMLLNSESAIILGGGLIGIDIATEIIHTGIKLSIIEYGNNLLALQLDKRAAKPYQDKIEKAGTKIYTNCLIKELILDEEDKIKSIRLNDGRFVDGDALIVSAGVKPNTDFLKSSGIEMLDDNLALNWGIVINDRCESNLKDVYAAGDVCAGKDEIWPIAVQQGITAAYNMAGFEKYLEDIFGFRNSMNFFGLNTISVGDPNIELDGLIAEVLDDGYNYYKIVHRDGKIISAIFQGTLPYAGIYETMIKKEIDISHLNKDVFEIGYADFFKIDPKTGEFLYPIEHK